MPTSRVGLRKQHNVKGMAHSQTSTKDMVENFFEAMAMDPGTCCYGTRETAAALELYGVDELLVACHPTPPQPAGRGAPHLGAGLLTEHWEAVAAAHRARIHWIDAASTLGKRFCKGIHVAGILRWRIDPDDMDMMMESMSATATPQKQPRTQTEVKMQQPAQSQVEEREEAAALGAILPSELCSKRRFFLWLGESLRSELLNSSSAEALEVGVQVILADAHGGYSELAEALESSAAMLRSEGAERSGEQLAARWYTNGGVTMDELPPVPMEVMHHQEMTLLPRALSCAEECIQEAGHSSVTHHVAPWIVPHIC
mmetsp:Transcript_43589/g.100457  ORF Transcript_43589/g.100457 Transcript_43589/m.100457 type:complete len:314 (-) Transcript_43589:359-1300(-)